MSKLRRLLGISFWIVLWAAAAALIRKPLVFAGPADTARALIALAASPSFWHALGLTCDQILGGFFAAFVGSLLLGILADRYLFLRTILHPAMNFLKSVPVVCIIVILLLWMGSASVAPVVVILMVLPAYYFTIASALAEKNQPNSSASLTKDALRLMGVGPFKRFLSEGWAYLLPYLKATSSSVVGMAWKAGIAAQLIGLSIGTVGEQVFQAKALIEAPTLFALTISIVLCAFICEQIWLVLLGASKYLFTELALLLPTPSANGNEELNSQPGCVTGAPLSKENVSQPLHEGVRPYFLATGVSVWRGDKKVLNKISFSVPPSVVVMGVSGRGKTTLCETLLGLVKPAEGFVEAPSRVGVVFQQSTLVCGLTVKQNLALVAGTKKVEELFNDKEDALQVAGDFKELLSDIRGNQTAEKLSGGQTRRVELVRALLAPARALLLDEPFGGLDEQTKKEALTLLSEYLNRTKAPLLLVSHDKSDADALKLNVFTL